MKNAPNRCVPQIVSNFLGHCIADFFCLKLFSTFSLVITIRCLIRALAATIVDTG